MAVSGLLGGEAGKLVITALLAAFGGLARILSQKQNNGLKAANVLSGCFVASFSGILAFYATGYFNLPINVTYVIAGICGWMGPQVIDMIANFVLQKTGINLQINGGEKPVGNDPGKEKDNM